MNFLSTFKFSTFAIIEIFLISACGFVIAKKRIISADGLKMLSRLVIELTLPILIFCRLLRDFNFQLFSNWWLLPILSFLITLLGLSVAFLFLKFNSSLSQKKEFISLIAFQNSGYLPLALAATILPRSEANQMFIYIFLFLLGFNGIIWSFGVRLLSEHNEKRFEFGSLFTPPLIAILAAFLIIFLNWQNFIPCLILKPLKMIGDCTVPLGMMIIGGNLAFISAKSRIKKSVLINLGLAKLIFLPIISLFLIALIKPPRLIGFLILMQTTMPSAVSLSIIAKCYSAADCDFINQSILWTHLISLITIPLFLSLFNYIGI